MKKIVTLLLTTPLSIVAFAQWDTLTTNTTTNFNSICFKNNQIGVAVGYDPISTYSKAFGTTDGGTTWSTVEYGAHKKNDVIVTNQGTGWMACDSGFLMKSYASFNLQMWAYGGQIGTNDFRAIYFPTDTIGFVGGENGVLYKTTDAGYSWDTLNSTTNLSINDIYFKDVSNGWIVGDGGFMASTTDGGQTWTSVAQPYLGFFKCNGFATVGTTLGAFAVGNSGDLIQSTDGGTSWVTFTSNTSHNLNSVRFSNDLAGIICGDSGLIYRTQDGGITWVNESMSYVKNTLNGICFSSDSVAFICGSGGRILKSQNDISSVHPIIRNTMSISAYPNPFAETLNIAIALEKTATVQLNIMDVSGRTILLENEGILNEGKQVISVQGISSLSSGMYFVRVISENGETVIPVVKR